MNEIEKAKLAFKKVYFKHPDDIKELSLGVLWDAFRYGYKAALAANTWVAIESADDLPKQDGNYLVLTKDFDVGGYEVWAYEKDASGVVDEWKRKVVAYMPIPSYTPEAK